MRWLGEMKLAHQLLQSHFRELIMQAAEYGTMPADSILKRISELENAIEAVEAVTDEERGRRQR